jgi:GDSL-like Lipase/Acylhydrolase family
VTAIQIGPQELAESYLSGHAELELGERGGVIPHRLPATARAQSDDPGFHWVEACPAGVRLRLRTAASWLELTLAATASKPYEREASIPRLTVREADSTTVLELDRFAVEVADNKGDVTLVDAEPAVLRIEREPLDAELEILLPHGAHVELLGLEANAEVQPAAPSQAPRWVHYGSSISHCLESESPERTWPAQVASAMGWELRNLAFAGHAQLDQAVARVIRDEPADLITLKLGINVVASDTMRYRTFQPAVHGFLDTVREGHPTTPVVVISAVSCPILEQVPGPVFFEGGRFRVTGRTIDDDIGALTLADTREIVQRAVAQRSATDSNLHFLGGLELFGHDDASLLYDDLHPDQHGYDLIGKRFMEKLPVRPRAGG